jgi:hypothetical protein
MILYIQSAALHRHPANTTPAHSTHAETYIILSNHFYPISPHTLLARLYHHHLAPRRGEVSCRFIVPFVAF